MNKIKQFKKVLQECENKELTKNLEYFKEYLPNINPNKIRK